MKWAVIASRDLKAWAKDPRRMAPTILMPILMLGVMYGAFYDYKPRHVTVAVLNESGSNFKPIIDYLKHDKRINIKYVNSVNKGKYLVKTGQVPVFIYVPKNFPKYRATVFYDPTDPLSSNYVRGKLAKAWAKEIGKRMKNMFRKLFAMMPVKPPHAVSIPSVSGDPFKFETYVKGLKYFDFLAPGLIVIGATMGSIFGLGRVMMEEVESGVAYSLFAAPIRSRDVVLGRFVSMSFWGVVRTAIAIVTVLVLGAKILHPFLLFFIASLSVATMVGLGLLVASLARRSEVAEMVTGALTVPMMFLAGIFMPPSVMPWWAVELAKINPLYYMGDAARKAAMLGYIDMTDVVVIIGFAVAFVAAGAALYDGVREYL